MDLDKSKNIYLNIIKIYTNFPAGFLSEKISIAKEILELYREISISLEIGKLESQLKIEKPVKESLFKSLPGGNVNVHLQTKDFFGTRKVHRNVKLDKLKIYNDSRIKKPLKKLSKRELFRPLPVNAKLPSQIEDIIHKTRMPTNAKIEKLREMSLYKKTKFKKPEIIPIVKIPNKKPSNLSIINKTKELKKMLIKRRLDRAKLKLDKGNINEARKEFESVLRLDSDNPDAKNMLLKIN